MSILSGGLKGLAQSGTVLRLLESCGSNIFLGVLMGAVVTAIIQSSSAMTALVIAMGAAGVLTLPAAIALTLGANIGTTVTAQIASIGSTVSSRRLAMAQLTVNFAGVAVFIPFVPWFARMVALTSVSLPRQIANAHTIFNVAVTLALIPCVGALVWLVKRFVRGRESQGTSTPQFLSEEVLATPSMALSQTRKEVLRMADMATRMIRACHRGLLGRNRAMVSEVFEVEESVDSLKRSIEDYLDRIHREGLSEKESRLLHALHHVTGDIERVGDQVVNVAQRAVSILRGQQELSEPALHDLNDMFEKTTILYRQSIESLREEDQELARHALALEEEVDQLEREYKANHLARLEQGQCSSTAGVRYVEILHNLERIGDHAVNIAGDVLHTL